MVEVGAPRIILPRNAEVTSEAIAVDINASGQKKEFVVVLGDLTEVKADAIVCPANPGFEFAGFGGVQSVLERRAGMAVFDEAEAKAKVLAQTENGVDYGGFRGLPTGYAIPTTAGKLSERYRNIIHVNSMPRGTDSAMDDIDVVRISVDKTLAAAERLSLRSVAFPALGTGLFGMDLRDCLLGTLAGVRTFYDKTQPDARLERTLLVIYAQPSLNNAQTAKGFIEQQLF